MQKQQGFTLIELMIVVAIIGILAAIAIPQYQNYVARSQATEALSVSAPMKTDVTEAFQMNGSLPDSSAINDIGSEANPAGKYVGVASWDGTKISVSFVNGSLNGKTMNLTPTKSGDRLAGWTCGGLDQSYLPSGCKSSS